MQRIANLLIVTAALSTSLLAQPVYTTLFSFQGSPSDTESPSAALIRAANGTLYGTSYCCNAFALAPPLSPGGAWTETLIASFLGAPYFSGVVFGPDASLYGTLGSGGPAEAGSLFQLTPPKKKGGTWTNSTIYAFTGGLQPGQPSADGGFPEYGVTLGPDGSFYGTTSLGGSSDYGTLFQLAPPASPGGAWTETVLYSFAPQGANDGGFPYAGVTVAPNGAIYGTTYSYGVRPYLGTVWELTPSSVFGGTWTFSTVYSFLGGPNDGSEPYGSLALGSNGVLYGNTYHGGTDDFGAIYSLTPPATPGGAWTEAILHSFTGPDGVYPFPGPILGTTGVLYGTTQGDKNHHSTIWSLQPPVSSGGEWTLNTLHRYTGPADIQASLTLGAADTLYGVTSLGGTVNSQCQDGCGTVFSLKIN